MLPSKGSGRGPRKVGSVDWNHDETVHKSELLPASEFEMRGSYESRIPVRWSLIFHATRITGARRLGVARKGSHPEGALPVPSESPAQKSRSASLIASARPVFRRAAERAANPTHSFSGGFSRPCDHPNRVPPIGPLPSSESWRSSRFRPSWSGHSTREGRAWTRVWDLLGSWCRPTLSSFGS